jgi:hypothetical protein
VAVWALLKAVVKAYYAVPLSGREFDLLHWPYSVQLLQLGVALGMVLLLGRRARRYGLVPSWRADLLHGGGLAVLFIVLPTAAMALFGGVRMASRGAGEILSTVVFQFFLSGIGEEILYRGYMQSRLNQAFGRPFSVGGIRLGAGLFIAAGLFGLSHALAGFNPFIRSFRVDLFYGIVTGIWGLIYGLLREKTGSVLGAGILHGHEAVIENVVVTVPGQIAYVVGWAITLGILLGRDRRPSRDGHAGIGPGDQLVLEET